MSDLLTTPDLKQETAHEPAKRWRNWYLALVHYHTLDGTECLPNKKYPGSRCWPSKDTAESAALSNPRGSVRRGQAEYLGAFPVEDACP